MPMKRLAFAFAVAVGACTNPTVEPDARLSLAGEARGLDRRPLDRAEVRLVKYWSSANLRVPSAETLFADAPELELDGDLRTEVVARTFTDRSGRFSLTVSGDEVAKPGGAIDRRGRVEVATTVLVVRDPADPSGRSGAFTYAHTFQQSSRHWDVGRLELWDADARLVRRGLDYEASWRAGPTRMSSSALPYRWVIEAPAGGSRMTLTCRDEGVCERQGDRIVRPVSAAAVDRFFSAADGAVLAWVQVDGPGHRAVAEAVVERRGSPGDWQSVPIEGVWAASDRGEQDLSHSAAVDGNPSTRVVFGSGVREIYVKLRPTVITEAGVLGARLDRPFGCVDVEFTGTAHGEVSRARSSSGRDWQSRGRFCGDESGEVGALVSFGSGGGVTFAWMRLVAVGGSFREIGEVAVFARD